MNEGIKLSYFHHLWGMCIYVLEIENNTHIKERDFHGATICESTFFVLYALFRYL